MGVVLKAAAEALVLAARGAQRLVQVEGVLHCGDHAPGDVRAVVGRALKIGQKIGPDKARLNAAIALLHAKDVARAHRLLERVYHLL